MTPLGGGGLTGSSTARGQHRARFAAVYALLGAVAAGAMAVLALSIGASHGRVAQGCGGAQRGSSDLVSVDVATGVVRPLLRGQRLRRATVSPDGREIAFLSQSSGLLGRLQICDLARHSTRQLRLSVPVSDFPLSWQPSTQNLVFLGGDLLGYGADQRPFLVDVANRHLHQLGGDAPWYWDGAEVSPDGTGLALLLEWKYPDGHEPEQLAIYDRATGRMTRLAGSSQVSEITSLSWSPDGSQIAFSAAGGNPHGALYVVGVATHRVRPLLIGGAGARDPAWSPDGKSIAFVRPGRRPSLWVLDLRTMLQRRVATGGVGAPSWLPDGRTLVLVRNS